MYVYTHFQSGSFIRTKSSASSRGGQPASLLQTKRERVSMKNDSRQYAVRNVKSLCSYLQCTAVAKACTRQETSASSYKEWELTLQCWKPAGSFPWAHKGWGWSTRTHQERSGALRRRRLCHHPNWRRNSGCLPPGRGNSVEKNSDG